MPVSFDEDPTDRFATLEYRTAVDDYMRDEVLPYVPDAWVDHDTHQDRLRDPADTALLQVRAAATALDEIDAEIKALEDEIQELLAEVTTR